MQAVSIQLHWLQKHQQFEVNPSPMDSNMHRAVYHDKPPPHPYSACASAQRACEMVSGGMGWSGWWFLMSVVDAPCSSACT